MRRSDMSEIGTTTCCIVCIHLYMVALVAALSTTDMLGGRLSINALTRGPAPSPDSRMWHTVNIGRPIGPHPDYSLCR